MDYNPHFIENEEIYEITVGTNPKEDMRFTVGHIYLRNTPNPVEVTYIEYDQNAFTLYGYRRILIFAKGEDGAEKLWKTLEDIPVSITCKL